MYQKVVQSVIVNLCFEYFALDVADVENTINLSDFNLKI